MTTYTDIQLKQALAKMLPEKLEMHKCSGYRPLTDYEELWWLDGETEHPECAEITIPGHKVLDTELLHLCWLVEKDLTKELRLKYGQELHSQPLPDDAYQMHPCYTALTSTWQQRVIALAKVKGIEICQ